MLADLARFTMPPPARTASRLAGWLLLPVGVALVPAAAALETPWLHAPAIAVLLASAAALAASLQEDPA